jgi:hypothetical protein
VRILGNRAVGGLNFLVHPGFDSAMHEAPDRLILSEKELSLLAGYSSHIHKLAGAGDSLLVLFAPPSTAGFRDDVKLERSWARLSSVARETLGGRAFIMSSPPFLPASDADGNMGSSSEQRDYAHKLRQIISARGFDLTGDTQPYVWGQTLKSCVSITARWVEDFMGLKKPPVIKSKLTDLDSLDPDTIKGINLLYSSEGSNVRLERV